MQQIASAVRVCVRARACVWIRKGEAGGEMQLVQPDRTSDVTLQG